MMAMTLDAYRTREKLTLQRLAVLLGLEGQSKARTVHRYLTHERIPDRAMIRRIEEVTSGEVTSNDFPDAPVRRSTMPKLKHAA